MSETPPAAVAATLGSLDDQAAAVPHFDETVHVQKKDMPIG